MKNNKFKLSLLTSLAVSAILTGCSNNQTQFLSPELNSVDITDTNATILSSDVFSEDDKKGANTEENLTLPTSNEAGSIESFVLASYRKTFNEYDKNKNGMIEQSELPGVPKSFAAMDKDNNKKLSFTEVAPSSTRVKQMAGWIYSFYKEMAKSVDTNGDGFISKEELKASEQLNIFDDLNYWDQTQNLMKKNTKAKGINYQQFSVFMNNSFLELSKKYANYKNPGVNRSGKLPVIIVQGYAEPSWYFMYGIYRDLRKNGWQALYPVNLFPNISDIAEQAKIVSAKIDQAKKEQGVSQVDYVAHSMGGLIGRYYMQNMSGSKNINHFVSIATPHYGTYVAWAGIGDAAKQMRPGSDFLNSLNSKNVILPNVKYTSIWTKTDEIVIPSENSILKGSRVMPAIENVGHFFIMWSDTTYTQIKDSLTDKL